MKPHLNEEHPNVAYHAGRLLSVYANVQKAALGDVNANIVQRFFPAAMATPSLVFQRLAKLGNFHLNKLEGGLRHFFEAKLGGIYSSLGDGLPKKFTPEEQTLFALGYYQQMAFDALDSKQRGAANQTARANLSSGETK